MNHSEKYFSYNPFQKQILGMLLRAKNVDKEYFIYLVSRLLRYQNQEEKEKEKDIHSQIQFLFDDSWCIEENNRIMEVAMHSDNETELLNLISEDRKKWRKQLIEDVCKYVNIENQEPVVKGLIEIDRAHFLLEELAPFADVDCPFPLFKGMTESALHAVLMTIKPLNPKKGERILICGAKGGYLSVLLAHLVGDKGKVIAIDWDERVINHCNEALKRAEIKSKNIEFKLLDDVTLGLPNEGDWDCIIVNGAIPKIPYELMHQLNDENGRILFFIADYKGTSQCFIVKKNQAILEEEKLSRFRYTPIPGKYGFDEIKSLQDQYDNARSQWKNDDVDRIKNKSPYPIAKSFFSAYNSRDYREKYDKAIKVGEVLIKYFAFIALAHEANSKRTDLGPTLKKITNAASYGSWWAATRDLIKGSKEDTKVISALKSDWNKIFKSKKIINGYNALLDKLSLPRIEQNSKVRLDDFLIKLIEYRNAFTGHGYTPPESHTREIADVIVEAFIEILSDLATFKQFELIASAGANGIRNEGKIIISEIDILIGLNHEKKRLNIDEEEMKIWRQPTVAILERNGSKPLLDLNPWIIWTDKGSNPDYECYVFNSRKGNEYKYTTYHNTAEFPDTRVKEDFDELLSRFPIDEKKEVNPAMKAFTMTLDMFMSDRKLDAEEFSKLIEFCLGMNLVPTADEAKQFIKDIITTDYPGTHIEE